MLSERHCQSRHSRVSQQVSGKRGPVPRCPAPFLGRHMTGSQNRAVGLSRAGLVSAVRLRGQTVCGNRWSGERAGSLQRQEDAGPPASALLLASCQVVHCLTGTAAKFGPQHPALVLCSTRVRPRPPGHRCPTGAGRGQPGEAICMRVTLPTTWVVVQRLGDSRDTSRAWSSLETQCRASRELPAEPRGRCRPAPCRPRLPGPGALAEPCSHLLPVRWRC